MAKRRNMVSSDEDESSDSDGGDRGGGDRGGGAAAGTLLQGENLELLQMEAERMLSRSGGGGRRGGRKPPARREPAAASAAAADSDSIRELTDDDDDDESEGGDGFDAPAAAAQPAGHSARGSGRLAAKQAKQGKVRDSLLSRSESARSVSWSEESLGDDADGEPAARSRRSAAARGRRSSAAAAAESSSEGEEQEGWGGALIGRQMLDPHTPLTDTWEPLLKADVFVDTIALEAMLDARAGTRDADWIKLCPDELGPLGLVLELWEKLKVDSLFSSAGQWKARIAKHGSRYRNWDSSDFTVRMMTQKWLRKMKGDLGGKGRDLAGFWANGSRNIKLVETSYAVQQYNRLQRSVASRPSYEASAAVSALQTSDESESDEEMYENFVANDDSDEDDGESEGEAGSGSSESEVDERTLHRNLVVAEAKADADRLLEFISEGGRRQSSGGGQQPLRRQSSQPTPLAWPAERRRSSGSGRGSGEPRPERPRREKRKQPDVVDIVSSSDSESAAAAAASSKPADARDMSEGSGDSSGSETEQRRMVEGNRQKHREGLYEQRAAAARKSPGSASKQSTLDAFLPKHAERAAKLAKVARSSGSSWAEDLRIQGTSEPGSRRSFSITDAQGGGTKRRKKSSSSKNKNPTVAPPRWRDGERPKPKAAAAADDVFGGDDRNGGQKKKRRRSAVPVDDDEDDEENDDELLFPQQTVAEKQAAAAAAHVEDGAEEEEAMVLPAAQGKQRRRSRVMVSDDEGSDSGSD